MGPRLLLAILLGLGLSGCTAHVATPLEIEPPVVEETVVTAGRVEVTIEPVRVEQGGSLIVAVFDDDAAWFVEPTASRTVTVMDESQVVSIDGLDPGQYAALVIHDRDDDGLLDTGRILPIPTEGYGVSRNARRMGRPAFEDAVFDLGLTPVALRVELVYY